jgi:glycine C-acetyltransferase
MLRLIPTAVHSLDDVAETISAFKAIKGKLDNGEYRQEKLAQFQ